MTGTTARNWTLGLDLGTHSLGYAAVAFDESGIPEEILYAGSIIHSGGQDGKKSHKEKAGGARRARNRYKQRRRNRREMDALLLANNMPSGPDTVTEAAARLSVEDIFDVRAALATKKLTDPTTLNLAVAATVRHMQTRRGFRNSWVSPAFIINEARAGYSVQYQQLHNRCSEVVGRTLPDDLTPAQLFVEARTTGVPYRTKALSVVAYDAVKTSNKSREEAIKDSSKTAVSPEEVLAKVASKPGAAISPDAVPTEVHAIERGLLYQSLRRSDIIRELHTIANTQGLPSAFVDEASRIIIFNVHPSKGVEERVKLDDLPVKGKRDPRAPKASLTFQTFRITDQVANLRHVGGGRLSPPEQSAARDFLLGWSDPDESPTWADVAAAIGVQKLDKSGNLAKPSVNTTHLKILAKGGALGAFWSDPSTTDAHRVALIGVLLGDAAALQRAGATGAHVQAWVNTLNDTDIAGFDTLKLEPGRAAHSEATMLALTAFMHDPSNTPNDLHAARTSIFGVDDTWSPSPTPLGTPVGNPTVDANIRLTRRVLDMLVARIGCEPARVIVESARDIVNSASSRRDMNSAAVQRKKDKDAELKKALEAYAPEAAAGAAATGVRRADAMRLMLLHEQHGNCLYCGGSITLATVEVDHIVPTSRGGTNTRINLAATCRSCNGSKGNTPFAEWASEERYKETVARIKKLAVKKPSAVARRKWIAQYTAQLKAIECERPMASISWAAVEVRDQLEGALSPSPNGAPRVLLVPGRITSDVRYLGGIDTEKKPILLRYPNHTVKGKSRLDRRHHAIDAAVLTVIRQSTITVISERNLLREEAQLAAGGSRELPNVSWDDGSGGTVSGRWDAYTGGPQDRFAFAQTRNALDALRALLASAVAEDRIPVTRPVKWSPDTAGIHEAGISSFGKVKLGDAIPVTTIDRASTPALWTALTRLADFDPKEGLPENPHRSITVNGKHLTANDQVNFFPGKGGMLEVRGGYAVAKGIHHIRLMRCGTKAHLVRVYTIDAARISQGGHDVFTAPLAANSLSMRDAGAEARAAFRGAERWSVVTRGDEIVMTPEQCSSSTGCIKSYFEMFPNLIKYRFMVRGFRVDSADVEPSGLSDESLPKEDSGNSLAARLHTVSKTSAKQLLGSVVVSRRNLLGEERTTGTYALRSGVL